MYFSNPKVAVQKSIDRLYNHYVLAETILVLRTMRYGLESMSDPRSFRLELAAKRLSFTFINPACSTSAPFSSFVRPNMPETRYHPKFQVTIPSETATNTTWKSSIRDWNSSDQLSRVRQKLGRASKCATFVRSQRLCLRLSRHAQNNRQERCSLYEIVYWCHDVR